jgi:hypothetical protein
MFGSDPHNGRRFALDDRHSQRVQRKPFDRGFFDPRMGPHAFGEIREAHLMLGEPFLERQSLKDFLFGHLAYPFDGYLPYLKAPLQNRAYLTNQQEPCPAHGTRRDQPPDNLQDSSPPSSER